MTEMCVIKDKAVVVVVVASYHNVSKNPVLFKAMCCHEQDATIPLPNSTEFLQNVANIIQRKTENQLMQNYDNI